MSILLILAALVARVLAGCGACSWGDGADSAREQQQASRTAGSPEQKAGGAGSSGQALRGRLGHPALGDADAPVVLTEYSDYQ